MGETEPINLDALIVGGGSAGLWLLHVLRSRGHSALLVEKNMLGSGQTIASQGIIHGGVKYALAGALTESAKAMSDMPAIWRRCLAGKGGPDEPDLSNVAMRAQWCHLWESGSMASKIGALGARTALAVKPKRVQAADIPAVLTDRRGVRRLDEQVIEPGSFIDSLAKGHHENLVHGEITSVDDIVHVALDQEDTETLWFRPLALVLTAGRGNADLRLKLGLANDIQQNRPLHMVVVRGLLPELNGHCIDGAGTRLTITSARDTGGKTIWQLGGQLAERGVESDPAQLIDRAVGEIGALLPAVDLGGTEWMTYRVDRAEMAMRGRSRPADVQFKVEPCPNPDMTVVTAWPTKLALVPRLAKRVADQLGAPAADHPVPSLDPTTPRPTVALPPWEEPAQWTTVS